jgi:hypothetical protein
MATNDRSSSAACCFKEKRILVETLSNCAYCSTSFKEFKRCRREASRDSRARAKECMIG